MKKNKIILILIILVLLVIVAFTSFIINNRKIHNYIDDGTATGHWYEKPKSADEITIIMLSYNNNKDHVAILEDAIVYYAYDKNGERISNRIEKNNSALIKYIYYMDLIYLNEYDEVENMKWYLKVDVISGHCLKSGKRNEPFWFKRLLKKLEVDKYGYLSEK